MASSDPDHETIKPSEQRGGTTPNETEAREKGMWARTASEGIVPAELGGSDARATCSGRIRSSAARFLA